MRFEPSLTPSAVRQRRCTPLLITLATVVFSTVVSLAQTLYVPVRWCGIEGAPSMVDPGVVGEHTTDDVLWRRHERPTDAIYMDMVDMSFRSGATAAIKNGPLSFPIIRDPLGTGGHINSEGEAEDAALLCRRVWQMGDPLYYDANNNGVANSGVDTLLSVNSPVTGMLELGHNGAPLVAAPVDVRYVDANGNVQFDIGEHLYRDENVDGTVDAGDTLLCPGTEGTVIGDINLVDLGRPLRNVGTRVKYVDLIRQPPNTYNIGYPQVKGVTAVSANDLDIPGISFPVHGIAALGIGGNAGLFDDASQYLPPGPDFRLFEIQLVAHEFGHAFGLSHGNQVDMFGTACGEDNVMQYCWEERGVAGAPNLFWVGVGAPSSGQFNATQVGVMREHVQTTILAALRTAVAPMLSARTDGIGDVPTGFEFMDITDFSVMVDLPLERAEFALATRRPCPTAPQPLRFYIALDIDGNPFTGGAPQTINNPKVPTDFDGAEYLISVDMPTPQVLDADFYRYDTNQQTFVMVPANVIAARRCVDAEVDFPGRGVAALPIRQELTVFVPLDALARPFARRFRVEYISEAPMPNTNVVDRARSQGMNFDAPVFPVCSLNPEVVTPGGSTLLRATGLLPLHHVHVFLGDELVTDGVTDSNGVFQISMAIPENARSGQRLVTAGTGAVTADCALLVDPLIEITDFTYEPQTGKFTLRWKSRVNGPFNVEASMDLVKWDTIAFAVASPYVDTLPQMGKCFLRVRTSQ